MHTLTRILVISCFLPLLNTMVYGQSGQTQSILGDELNTITTAVPFLLVAPDSRAGALGDAGVASTPDANSMHWNPAKYAFSEKAMGFSVSYSPWLKALVNDINLAYLTGYMKLDENSAIATSLLFFSLGEITFTNDLGTETGTYKPNEFSLDFTYSRKFTKQFSMAVAARYIYSNLTMGQFVGGLETHPGQSFAVDIATYYQKPFKFAGRSKGNLFAFGANISNIGAKISYTASTERDFIPTNLKFGPSLTLALDDYNTISVLFDVNKLLVPTPPIYATDTNGVPLRDPNGDLIIQDGMDPNVGVVEGMIQSFYDAPGGFEEEMREFTYSVGVEYWYDKQFAVRGGYFHENQYKGNRKYFTLGAGLRYNVFGLDFAYLIPVDQRNPLENTIRFSLLFDMDAFKDQNTTKK